MSFECSIQLLDTHVIHQLKSTLVISTFPQCVKELIYNAIDASSKNIEILIDTEKHCIQVNDNGTGISFDDLNRIGQRHATSKYNQKHTFGFRGEALASVIQQSIVQIISRYHTSVETYAGLWRDGAKIGDITPFRHRKAHPGTTVIVRDLFYKHPVRRKHQSTSQHAAVTESVKQWIASFAICFPAISFALIESSRNMKLLVSKKTEDSLGIFRQLFGQSISQYMIPLEMQKGQIRLNGYFSTKYYPNKTLQFIYVNNYLVPRNEFYKLVNLYLSFPDADEETGSTKGKGRLNEKYPIFMIKLEHPQWTSFHISPYLEILADVSFFDILEPLVSQITLKFLELQRRDIPKKKITKRRKIDMSVSSVSNSQSIYATHSSTNFNKKKTEDTKLIQNENFVRWWDPNHGREFLIDKRTGFSYPVESLNSQPDNNYIHKNKIDRSRLKTQLIYDNSQNNDVTQSYNANNNYDSMNVESMNTQVKLSKSDLQTAKVLGQLDQKYIMVKIDSKLVMIDQHAADERVKLELMTVRLTCPEINDLVTLEPRISIRLTLSRSQLVNERLPRFLKYWGIHIATTDYKCDDITNEAVETIVSRSRYFSTNEASPHFTESRKNQYTRYYVTHLPRIIADRCLENHQLLNDLIYEYMHWIEQEQYHGNDSALVRVCPKGIMEILKSKACRAAVMFNDPLTLEECETIVGKLSNCNYPFQCAHGRPSAVPVVSDISLLNRPVNRIIHWNKFNKN